MKVNQEEKFEKDKKLNPFNLKTASNLEYEKNLVKALGILRELRLLNKKKVFVYLLFRMSWNK